MHLKLTPIKINLLFRGTLTFLLFIAVALDSAAQQHGVRVLGSPRQEAVLLRWAPASPAVWRLGNEYGYQVERYTILRDGDVIPFRVKVTDNTDYVANVWVYVFRQNSDITFRAYPMSALGSDLYGFDGVILERGITEYYFVAEDNFGVSTFYHDELNPLLITTDVPWSVDLSSSRRHTIHLAGLNSSLTPPVWAVDARLGGEVLEVGDYIGVFYSDTTYNAQGNPVITQKCGGFHLWKGVPFGFVNFVVVGDNPSTSEKDGFVENEAFVFKIFSKRENREFDASHTFMSFSPSTAFTTNGISQMATVHAFYIHRVAMQRGLNLWSTYLEPRATSFNFIMAPYMGKVTEVADHNGDSWYPNTPSSALTNYIPGYGYEVYVTGDVTIEVAGNKSGASSVSLAGNLAGTLVGCPYTATENVEAAFAHVASNIYVVDKYINDGAGYVFIESYSPMYNLNQWTDKNMNPGEAYYVYAMNSDPAFSFPAPTGAYAASLKSANPDVLSQKVTSVKRYMHLILPVEAWAATPQTSDEVRVYNEAGHLVAKASVQAPGAMIIIDGAKIEQDESFSLRLWSSVTGAEQPVNVTQWAVGSGRYDNLKIAVAGRFEVDTPAATLSGGISVSPNPTRDKVTVSFRLEEGGTVSLSLINMLGSTVHAAAPAEYPAGANTATLDVSGPGKGIYLLNLQAGANTETVKLVIE